MKRLGSSLAKRAKAAALTLFAPLLFAGIAFGKSASTPQPLVVFIHSRVCPVCAKVRPMLDSILPEYQTKVKFIRLDVTDAQSKEESKKLAQQLKISSFFDLYEDTFPCVGFFNAKNKCVKELFGENSKDKYEKAFQKASETSENQQ